MSAKNIYSEASHQPPAQLAFASRKRLSPSEWDALAIDLSQGVQAALADRTPLEDNLDDWNSLYEMESDKDPNWPVVNAANIFVPLIPTQLDSLYSYIAAAVLVPALFMVTGLTDAAAKYAALVERYYNSELKRQRGSTTWFREFLKWLHLSLRDGTAYMEVLWSYRKTKMRVNQSQPRMEEDGQTPVLDDDGQPVYDQVEVEVEKIVNEPVLKAVPLRDVIMIPASSQSIEDAAAVARVIYPYEQELMELVHKGILDKEEVELALDMVPAGATELPTSPQPTDVYTRGNQVGIGGGQGTQASKFFKNRGPIEVYRIHSRQYDLDNDDTTEENIFWVHRSTWRLLGWMRYQYFTGERPLFAFSPFPRPDDDIGFSLPGRLAGLQNEENAQRNQRLDEGVIRISPPFTVKKGSTADDEWKGQWGANQKIPVETQDGPDADIKRVPMEQLSQSAYVEEQVIEKNAGDFTGLSQPAIGQQSSGRRSATEARQRQAAAMTRTGLIAMHFRMSIRPVINFVHSLNKQYINSDQQFQVNQERLTLPPPVLGLDYSIDTAGASDPIDAPARRTETIGAAEIFMKFPAIAQNMMRQYYLLRKIAETFNWADVDQIIGTEQEAQQQAMAMQQQAQAQAMQGQGQPGQPGQPQPPQGQHGQAPPQ